MQDTRDRRAAIFVAGVYAGAILFVLSVLVYVGRIQVSLPAPLVAFASECMKDWARRFGLA
ncbi:hypothetical protein [Hydrogenophaga sp. NFH-34]|uniref:hypothetical protein n=1 Tax=Hydrogenophaga sp. NFH-34 TaxID=2744446 RepID=UPI001F47170B|nr:hypothetical protein [Hydrogenophaga sp. NFH-34]